MSLPGPGRTALALALYAALTVLVSWPLVLRLWVMDAGDSPYFAWAMAWAVHALLTAPAQIPHANMYHPLRYTLFMDEPVLGTAVLALPFAAFTDDAVFAFNVVRLLTYVLSAMTARQLARELGAGEGPALLAGGLFAFSPIRIDQVAHLSTLGTQWLPLVLLFLVRFARHGRVRDGLLTGAAFAAAAYACGYHGVIGLAVLPCAALPLLWGRFRLLPRLVPGAILAVLLLVPLYLLHHRAMAPFQFERSVDETILYSAPVEAFFATSSLNLVWGRLTEPFRTTQVNNLFPGLLPLALAAVGGAALVRRRAWPSREALALVVLAAAAVVVALGPEVRLFGETLFAGPFGLLREVVPPFRQIRVTSRAGAYVALALAMLAARVLARWQERPRLLALLAVLGLAETLMIPIPMAEWSKVIDTRRPGPPVYEWLAAQEAGTVVAEMPMQDIKGVERYPAYHESVYLMHSTRHWQRLVNGFAGFEPPPYVDLRERCRRFPSEDSIVALRGRGVRYVIVHLAGYGPIKGARVARDLPRFPDHLREVARFGDDVVYEVLPAPPR